MLNSPNEYVLNGGGNPGLVEISKKKKNKLKSEQST